MSLPLTLLPLHGLLQQEFSHTLPVFEQLLRTFPQRVHQVGRVLVELHARERDSFNIHNTTSAFWGHFLINDWSSH